MKLRIIFLLIICPFFLHSQEKTKDVDNSVSAVADTLICLDSSGGHLSEKQFQDSLNTGKYSAIYNASRKTFQLADIITQKKQQESMEGKELPSLKLPDINQKIISIGEDRELTLLSFWNITCGPCIQELFVFNILATEYPEVSFVAISSNSKEEVNTFLKNRGLEWKNLLIIPDCKEYFEKFNVQAIPVNMIIGSDRVVKKVFVGRKIREILLSFEEIQGDK